VAAYSFSASSGTMLVDNSGQNNTVTLQNGPAWTGGRYGNALSFDGSNDVGIANSYNSALNLAGRSFTLSAWINPRNNNGWQMIVNKPYTSSHSSPYFDWSLHREKSSGRIVAFLGCEGVQRVSNASVPVNTWTHVAVTYDGTSIRHYINGVLDRTTAVSCSVTNTNSRPIRIGANGGGGEVMDGLIDDVRVYNRPLSAAEIQTDMGRSADTPLPDSSAPVVSVTAPSGGTTLSGTANITANASDDVAVAGVQFKVDNQNVGSEDMSAPYSVAWNTTQLANGSHAITATARDTSGKTQTSGLVNVNVSNGGAAPTLTFSASPTSISSGSSSTLTWSSGNASSCTASGAWSGTKATSGSQSTGAISSTRTYSLSCSGPGGSVSRSATVTVSTTSPAPSITLTASPNSVPSGGTSTLTWTSSEATSCTASGAWSGSRPTSGSASTATLTAPDNTFTLTCTGAGGSASKSATVTVTSSSSGPTYGLDFPGSAATSGTVRFKFSNPLPMYPATYIWKVKPRQQSGYYTTFFWGNDGPFWWDNGSPNSYYGAHPYPVPSPNGPQRWEIATDRGGDFVSNENVVFDRWYTQALRVWSDGSGKHHEFYWDLPNTSRVIKVDVSSSFANVNPPNPALTFGDAPWNPSNEIMNGVIRGIQIYTTSLSLSDILSESSNALSTSAGTSRVWYLNPNPTPSDISDKSGAGHNPAWVGSERPRLWSGQ
jgi:hypothetical protein